MQVGDQSRTLQNNEEDQEMDSDEEVTAIEQTSWAKEAAEREATEVQAKLEAELALCLAELERKAAVQEMKDLEAFSPIEFSDPGKLMHHANLLREFYGTLRREEVAISAGETAAITSGGAPNISRYRVKKALVQNKEVVWSVFKAYVHAHEAVEPGVPDW